MVLLGAASSLIPLSEESLLTAIKKLFQHKSERIINLNIEAFHTGKKIAKEYTGLENSAIGKHQ